MLSYVSHKAGMDDVDKVSVQSTSILKYNVIGKGKGSCGQAHIGKVSTTSEAETGKHGQETSGVQETTGRSE